MLRQYLDLPRPVHVLCLGTFINRAGAFIVPFLTIYMSKALGAGDAFAPFAMGVFGCGSICGSLIGGQLADRVGRRSVMLASLFGAAAILLVLSRISDPAWFLVGVFFFALISDTYRPAASAMIADLTTPAQRTHAFSLMYVSINLGFAIGPALGGAIAEWSFQWLFIGDAATCALYALIILVRIQETLGRSPRGAHTPAHDAEAPQVRFGVAARHMLGNGTFVLLCGASFLSSLVFMQAMSTFPLYLDGLGFTPAQYGRVLAVNGALIVLGQLPLTHWMVGKPRAALLGAAGVLTAAGFGLKALAYDEGPFIGTVVLWTLGEMMQLPLLQPIVSELAPERMRGRYMGVFGVCFSGANMIGAPIGGLVLSHAGGAALWLACAGLGLLAAGMYVLVGRRIDAPAEA